MSERQVYDSGAGALDADGRDVLDFIRTHDPVPPLDPEFAKQLGDRLRRIAAEPPPATAPGISWRGSFAGLPSLLAACRGLMPAAGDRLAPLRLAAAVAVVTLVLGGAYWAVSSGRLPLVPANQGPAAIADTVSSAPQTVSEAAALLGVEESALRPLPPGASVVNGWVLEAATAVVAHVPQGVCIDWSPAAATLSGEQRLVWQGEWTRTEMLSDGQFSGLQATLYWTPCYPPAPA